MQRRESEDTLVKESESRELVLLERFMEAFACLSGEGQCNSPMIFRLLLQHSMVLGTDF